MHVLSCSVACVCVCVCVGSICDCRKILYACLRRFGESEVIGLERSGVQASVFVSVWLVSATCPDLQFIKLGQYDAVAVKFGVFSALMGMAMSSAF